MKIRSVIPLATRLSGIAFYGIALYGIAWTMQLNAAEVATTPAAQAPDMQVEVIIFSQQDVYKNELNNRKPSLSFPENALYLINPEEPNNPTNQLHACEAVVKESVEQPAILAENTAEIVPPTPDEEAVINEPAEPEKPYVMLDKSLYQMQRDAYTLNRKPGFKVLYHQAWRQPKLPNKQSPWIIIKAGPETAGRNQLEGAIRVYQSRYPHFQANLWKTELYPALNAGFSAQTENASWLGSFELPALPKVMKPETRGASNCLPEAFEIEKTREEGLLTETEEFPGQAENDPQYTITDLQHLKQSARLHYSKMAYIDHPNMGILVLLSSYEASAE